MRPESLWASPPLPAAMIATIIVLSLGHNSLLTTCATSSAQEISGLCIILTSVLAVTLMESLIVAFISGAISAKPLVRMLPIMGTIVSIMWLRIRLTNSSSVALLYR